MNKLALGTVQFGLPYGIANRSGKVSVSEAKSMLRLAQVNGTDTLDTAIAYGDSEICLGQVGIRDFNVVTKLPARPAACTDVSNWVQRHVQESLNRLGVASVYGLLLHRSEQLLQPDGVELYRALLELKTNGLVQKIGVSVYAPSELDELVPKFGLDLVQAPFNIVDQRLHDTGWLKRLKHLGVEIHTRSVFLQGLLLMKPSEIPEKFAPWNNLWNEWGSWLERAQVSPVQACLAFSNSFEEIDRIVVGADSVRQLTEILAASKAPPITGLPNIKCDDPKLINPTNWQSL